MLNLKAPHAVVSYVGETLSRLYNSEESLFFSHIKNTWGDLEDCGASRNVWKIRFGGQYWAVKLDGDGDWENGGNISEYQGWEELVKCFDGIDHLLLQPSLVTYENRNSKNYAIIMPWVDVILANLPKVPKKFSINYPANRKEETALRYFSEMHPYILPPDTLEYNLKAYEILRRLPDFHLRNIGIYDTRIVGFDFDMCVGISSGWGDPILSNALATFIRERIKNLLKSPIEV